MADWWNDARDGHCYGHLVAQDGVAPYLYIAAVNVPPHAQYQVVYLKSLSLWSDADFIWLLTLQLPEGWPPTTVKHPVIHANRWAQSWHDGTMTQPGINTEIVRSKYACVDERPEIAATQQLASASNLEYFNAMLLPGQALLLVPNKNGSCLTFGTRLTKFSDQAAVKKN